VRNYVPDSTLAGTQHKLCTYRSDPITITIDQVAAHQSEERTRSNHGAAVVVTTAVVVEGNKNFLVDVFFNSKTQWFMRL
jgi:hypothetical protein